MVFRRSLRQNKTCKCSHGVAPNLRFMNLCDCGTLRRVSLSITASAYYLAPKPSSFAVAAVLSSPTLVVHIES